MTLEDSLLTGMNSESLNNLKLKDNKSLEEKIILINAFIDILEYTNAKKMLEELIKELENNSQRTQLNIMIEAFLENKLALIKSNYTKIINQLETFSMDNYLNLLPREKSFTILICIVKAEAFFHLGNNDLSQGILSKIKELVENTSTSQPTLSIDVINGLCYRINFMNCYYLGDMDKALEYVEKGLKIYTKTNNIIYLAYFYNFHGVYSTLKGYYYTALNSFKKCLDYFQSLGEPNDVQGIKYTAGISSNIAQILGEQGRLNEAIKITQTALNIYEQIGSSNDIANFYSLLGCYHRDLRNFDEAEDYLFKAYNIRKNLNDPFQISDSLLNICILEERTGRLSPNSISIIEFPKAFESKTVLLTKYIIEGLINYSQKEYSKALEDLDRVLDVESVEFSRRNLINEYKAEILLEKNDFLNFQKHLKIWKAQTIKNNLIPSLFKLYLIDFRFELLFSNFLTAQISLDKANDLARNLSDSATELVKSNYNLLKKRKSLINEVKLKKDDQYAQYDNQQLVELKNYMKQISVLLADSK